MRVRSLLIIPAAVAAVLAGAPDVTTAQPVPARSGAVPQTEPADATLRVALSNNSLIVFDAANSAAADPALAVTGVNGGNTLVGIDFRPQNGFLYALGHNGTTGSVQLYHVSYRTGVATAIGTPASFVATDGVTPAPVTGTGFGFDVNPTVDRVRVVTDTGQSFRINPNTGAPVDGGVAATGVQMDGSINGATTTVDGAAYTNNQQNATVTTLYTLSAASDRLFIQNPPNNGTQTLPVNVTLNGAPLDFTAANGFDILPGVNAAAANAVTSGSGYAVLSAGGYSGLYVIDLPTGAASFVGPLGAGGAPVQGFAVQRAVAAGGLPAVALSADGTQLIRFDTSAPGPAVTVPVTGTTAGDVLVGIDWRPQTGQLFGLGSNATANTASLYLLDPRPVRRRPSAPPARSPSSTAAARPSTYR